MPIKVLIIDDEPSMRYVLSRMVQRLGHTAFEITNGPEAETIINDLLPEVVLLDIMMPYQDGYQTCIHLRDKGYQGTIIMVSAMPEQTAWPLAQTCGANDYLQKPVSKETLENRLHAVTQQATHPYNLT